MIVHEEQRNVVSLIHANARNHEKVSSAMCMHVSTSEGHAMPLYCINLVVGRQLIAAIFFRFCKVSWVRINIVFSAKK